MKLVSLLVLTFLSFNVKAQNISLKDYSFNMTDIRSRGHSKESLYSSMNKDMIKLSSSICSNRALIWVNDFKRFQNIDAGKIFLFYTGKTGRAGRKTWWYHVAPVVSESGQPWVLDPGFPAVINTPLNIADWLVEFAGTSNCREIRAGENELIEKMFSEQVFPEFTQAYGRQDCYYHIAPAGLWTPGTVANHLLGVDETGTPVPHVGTEIDQYQVLDACKEAISSSIGRMFGGQEKKCKKYLGIY